MGDTKDWKEGLSPDQIRAAEHVGSHARLLAGPGTGKTLTLGRRALALVLEGGVEPSRIIALTFTRVAAAQLRDELRKTLEPLGYGLPHVSTLHSFALRQLLRNPGVLVEPLRIADDWEENYIIHPDLKAALGYRRVEKVRELFEQLSAGWDTLRHDQPGWEQNFPDAKFLGAWRSHRQIFGYTLRAELVYQLERALNQHPDFRFESNYSHLLIDEYQDLNPCDLSVIEELASRGIELFVAGDDDQSIYGFRYADPTGIRGFPTRHPGTAAMALETCFRCDRSVLRLAEFVADQDIHRLPRRTSPREDAQEGEVHILVCQDQAQEAEGVVTICRWLLDQGIEASQILILVRSDRRGQMSGPLWQALTNAGIRVAESTEKGPLDTSKGRLVLATLRLLQDPKDSLAWRTVLQLRRNGIGSEKLDAIRKFAEDNAVRFASALRSIRDNPATLDRFGQSVADEVRQLEATLSRLVDGEPELAKMIDRVASEFISDSTEREKVAGYLNTVAAETGSESLAHLIQALSASLGRAEQELVPEAVNILTMHRAKGLTADTVIIVGAERQFIPGRNVGVKEGDERRLLYVSMTRAKHRLFITYCTQRTGSQSYLGSDPGNPDRRLTTFLSDGPIRVERMSGYVQSIQRR
ncbi:MAG: ATP-dependent helicase [Chloroflexi bacterium]|nr:ATP-dependent helicase [Chloroflexota bacterium]